MDATAAGSVGAGRGGGRAKEEWRKERDEVMQEGRIVCPRKGTKGTRKETKAGLTTEHTEDTEGRQVAQESTEGTERRGRDKARLAGISLRGASDFA